MAERRKSPRASCRLQARVLKGTERVRARVVDVSESGLCLISPVWMKPRQDVEIEIDVPKMGVSKVRAEIWHIRREQSRITNNKVWIAGVMVVDADPGYDRLLQAAGVAPSPALEADGLGTVDGAAFSSVLGGAAEASSGTPASGAETAAQSVPSASEAEEHRVFRIRCKARGGPRSRVLTLAAESVEHAERLATRDLGDTWTVLEVREA